MSLLPLIFCNKTKYVQTDVGICFANNPGLYLNEGEIVSQPLDNTVNGDLRNAEHLFVLSVDKFENPMEFKVRNIYLSNIDKFFHIILDNDAKDKSQNDWFTNANSRSQRVSTYSIWK